MRDWTLSLVIWSVQRNVICFQIAKFEHRGVITTPKGTIKVTTIFALMLEPTNRLADEYKRTEMQRYQRRMAWLMGGKWRSSLLFEWNVLDRLLLHGWMMIISYVQRKNKIKSARWLAVSLWLHCPIAMHFATIEDLHQSIHYQQLSIQRKRFYLSSYLEPLESLETVKIYIDFAKFQTSNL